MSIFWFFFQINHIIAADINHFLFRVGIIIIFIICCGVVVVTRAATGDIASLLTKYVYATLTAHAPLKRSKKIYKKQKQIERTPKEKTKGKNNSLNFIFGACFCCDCHNFFSVCVCIITLLSRSNEETTKNYVNFKKKLQCETTKSCQEEGDRRQSESASE